MDNDKLNMQSTNITAMNIDKIAALFPNCVTETAEGKRIDFDLLKQELSAEIVEGNKERYRLEWPGKREAIVTANLPTTNTLRPVREDSVDFDTTENIYIEGDNLEVLKLLQESYLNKIKMIYIDPPYNTGKDFVYKDNFTMGSEEWLVDSGQKDEYGTRLQANPETSGRYHSDWLSMMYPRLKLARNLLTDDGVIFISIDDNEVHNLRKICDEIFGEGNFVGEMSWLKKRKGSFLSKKLISVTEYILIYGKNDNLTKLFGGKPDESESQPLIKRTNNIGKLVFPKNIISTKLPNGIYESGDYGEGTSSVNLVNSIEIKDGLIITESTFEGPFIWSQSMVNQQINLGAKFIINTNNFQLRVYKIYEEDSFKGLSSYINGIELKATNEDGYEQLRDLLQNEKLLDYPKPINLISYLINSATYFNKDSIILDFFSGSATTAHAVMQLNKEDGGNRKYIMVQLPEAADPKSEAYKAGYKNICEIGKERIRRAGRLVSGQLSVVSGQKLVNSEQGVVDSDNSNKTKINYDSKNISRVDSLAEGNGTGQAGLFDSEEATQGGIVRPVKSDAEGSGINSIEHSGGASEELNKGVSPISSDSQRFEGGIGNTATPMRESGLSDGGGNSDSNELSRGSEQNDSSTLQKTNHSQLTTNHSPLTTDLGFRVYRLDSSNMQEVYYKPQDYKQSQMDMFADNVKQDRSAEDLVTQIMLDWGLQLSLPIERKTIAGKEVYAVAGDSLYCCFDKEIDETFAKEVAKENPLRIVFRDNGFKDDTAKENVKQLLKQLAPSTEMRVI